MVGIWHKESVVDFARASWGQSCWLAVAAISAVYGVVIQELSCLLYYGYLHSGPGTLATSGVEVSLLARYPDCFQFPAASECVVSLGLTLLIIVEPWATVNWERASVSLAV